MKNGHLIELLSGYDKEVEVVIDGHTEFVIEQMGSDNENQLNIIKK